MSDINLTIIDQPTEINLEVSEIETIQVNFSDTALPDASVIANRILAQGAATAAEASAVNASASASSAASSASSAATSASEALTSAGNASNSAADADGFATSASLSANAASLSAQDALDSQNAAAASASDALDSAGAALASETAAQAILTTLTNGYLYLGDSLTDGSWRFFNDAGTLRLQKRVSGTWELLNEYTYP